MYIVYKVKFGLSEVIGTSKFTGFIYIIHHRCTLKEFIKRSKVNLQHVCLLLRDYSI